MELMTRQQRRAKERQERKSQKRDKAAAAFKPKERSVGYESILPAYYPVAEAETDPAKFREEGGRFGVGDYVTRDGTDVHQCISLPWDHAFHGTFRCVVAPSRDWTKVGEDYTTSCHRLDPVDYKPGIEQAPADRDPTALKRIGE